MRTIRTTRRRLAANPRAGATLVMALMVVMVVGGLTAAYLQLSLTVTRRLSADVDTKQAFYLAEGGLAEAYTGLAEARTGNVGTQAAPAVFGRGLFWVEATTLANGMVELESTGAYGSGRATLGMVVEPIEVGIASLGLFVADDVQLNPDTLVDSFDSEAGTYASQVGTPLQDQAVFGSNGDITIQGGILVRGDLMPGPTGTVTISGTSTLTGDIINRGAPEMLPAIDVPIIASQPAIVHGDAVPLVLAPGDQAYVSITVNKDSKLIVQGPATLVLGELYVKGAGEIEFDITSGPIDVYVTGDVDLMNDSLVYVTEEKTSELNLLVASPSSRSVFLGSSAQFYGFIYAPNAIVKVAAKFEVFGGLVAKGLNLAALSKLHQDVSLDPTRDAPLPVLRSWKVVDIPAGIAAKRFDPFDALGVDPATLPLPADAHQDQRLVLDYLDGSGASANYDGWESAFDWTNVTQINGGTRDGELFVAPVEPTPAAPSSPLIDLVNDPLVTSATLSTEMIATAPLPSADLMAAINRTPMMGVSDLYWAMNANGPMKMPAYPGGRGSSPLPAEVLLGLIGLSGFSSKERAWVLEQNSPLPTPVLDAAINRVPAMSPGDMNKVSRAQ